MVVLNPNNWHWVDRNTIEWTKEYMNRFNTWEVEDEGKRFQVTSVSSVQGDSNVSQRKGKVICYFDLALIFGVRAVNSGDDEEETGTVSVNEFAHDEIDFEITCSGFTKHTDIVKNSFVPKLREELLKYQDALIKEHSNSVQHAI
ncbi:HGL230Cp [Eremothecium sinecaudum]|uniref:HGL230Cp n=1 Tax=Eremothecium sinecaudum TaxID=45286 RepID=A0A109UZX6_9SACH|nr:HGL230Cp [Eremothecium sinecaudum]AMD22110.1 HGL230Cp [Eremothecium sinecaudum]